MLLLIHITIALASITVTTAQAFWPSRRKLQASAGLIALTLGTGTYLVASMHTSMLHACMTGLLYLAIALTGIAVGEYRASHAKQLS